MNGADDGCMNGVPCPANVFPNFSISAITITTGACCSPMIRCVILVTSPDFIISLSSSLSSSACLITSSGSAINLLKKSLSRANFDKNFLRLDSVVIILGLMINKVGRIKNKVNLPLPNLITSFATPIFPTPSPSSILKPSTPPLSASLYTPHHPLQNASQSSG